MNIHSMVNLLLIDQAYLNSFTIDINYKFLEHFLQLGFSVLLLNS